MMLVCVLFFFNDTATTEIYTLSLHDALPISDASSPSRLEPGRSRGTGADVKVDRCARRARRPRIDIRPTSPGGSEEHTSELQSRQYLVCRLLLEKKKKRHAARPPASTSCSSR